MPSVRQLKELLISKGIDCSTCIEKHELETLLHNASAGPQHVPAESGATTSSSQQNRVPAPADDGVTTTTPAPLHQVRVRRAWRTYLGIFDGDTDDEDEYHADAKRHKSDAREASGGLLAGRTPRERSFEDSVLLLPRPGPAVTVVATSDLHRHHNERYIANDTLSLAEWFESAHSPSHVDVALFAGDLGLEMEAESTSKPHTTSDAESLLSWRELLVRILVAKPRMHVVLVGGNHDGLLCQDDACLACALFRFRGAEGHTCRRGAAYATSGATPSASFAYNLEALLCGVSGRERVHVLCDSAVDVTLEGSGEILRVVGSPWTSYDTSGREHASCCHHWRPQGGGLFGGSHLGLREEHFDCREWWVDHWGRVGELLDAPRTPSGEPIAGSILVTHTPAKGILDIVGGSSESLSQGVSRSPAQQKSRARVFRCGDDVLRHGSHGPRPPAAFTAQYTLSALHCAPCVRVLQVLRETLEGLQRPPLLHAFGHVHAKQHRDEPPEGPRLMVSKRVGGCLFANVAAERQARPPIERGNVARALALMISRSMRARPAARDHRVPPLTQGRGRRARCRRAPRAACAWSSAEHSDGAVHAAALCCRLAARRRAGQAAHAPADGALTAVAWVRLRLCESGRVWSELGADVGLGGAARAHVVCPLGEPVGGHDM
jgi:hypothetical protein